MEIGKIVNEAVYCRLIALLSARTGWGRPGAGQPARSSRSCSSVSRPVDVTTAAYPRKPAGRSARPMKWVPCRTRDGRDQKARVAAVDPGQGVAQAEEDSVGDRIACEGAMLSEAAQESGPCFRVEAECPALAVRSIADHHAVGSGYFDALTAVCAAVRGFAPVAHMPAIRSILASDSLPLSLSALILVNRRRAEVTVWSSVYV